MPSICPGCSRARVQGWADEAILDAYEAERQPITEQVSQLRDGPRAEDDPRAARGAAEHRGAPAPRATRCAPRSAARPTSSTCSSSAAAGSTSATSTAARRIIADDGEEPPAYSMGDFTPSTVPGCRAPHFWLADGRSLYDAFGPRLHAAALRPARRRGAAVEAAARACGMPLAVLDVDAARGAARLPARLVLCRADQHVAWRGDRIPADLPGLIERCCAARFRGEPISPGRPRACRAARARAGAA